MHKHSMCTGSAAVHDLKFNCAVKVQACSAGDLHTIAGDCALHGSTACTDLSRMQAVLTQSPLPVWSECAMDRTSGRVLVDADRGRKKSANIIDITLAGRGNNRSDP